jgi:hypothetical protein
VFYLSPDLTVGRHLLNGINGAAPSTDAGTTNGGDGTVQLPAQYHGSVEAVDVEGSLGQGNLVIHTLDEQLTVAHVKGDMVNAQADIDTRYSIWKYTVGGTASVDTSNGDAGTYGSLYGYTGKPTLEVKDPGSFGNFFGGGINEDMQRGADGKFYFMQSRNNGGEAGVIVTDASGNQLYSSLTATRALPGGTATTPDILTGLRGLAVSPDQKWMAAIMGSSDVVAIPLVNGLPDLADRLVVDTGTNAQLGRDIAFDAADNIEYVSSGQQLLQILALGGQTTTTLSYDPSLAAGSQFAFNLSTGAATVPGDFNGDGKVDAQDYVAIRKQFSDLTSGGGLTAYSAWRANFGNGSGAGTSLHGSAVPEPASLALVFVGLIAAAAQRRRQA